MLHSQRAKKIAEENVRQVESLIALIKKQMPESKKKEVKEIKEIKEPHEFYTVKEVD